MNLPNDPVMLLSVINTKLRDAYASLDALCEDMGVARGQIESALGDIGYTYDEQRNRFC